MTVLAIIVGSLVASLMFVLALRQFVGLVASRRRAIGAAEFSRGDREFSLLAELDERLGHTRLGRWLARELDLAGLTHRPIFVLAVAVAVGGVVTWLLWQFVSTVLAVLGNRRPQRPGGPGRPLRGRPWCRFHPGEPAACC